jgi:hypothetical protein
MLPEFTGLDQQLILPVRRALIDLLDRGAISLEASNSAIVNRVARVLRVLRHEVAGRKIAPRREPSPRRSHISTAKASTS